MKAKTTRATRTSKTPSSAAPAGGLCIATVARWDAEGVAVTLPHGAGESVAARVMLPPGVALGAAAVPVGQSVVVMLDAGGPVVMGVLQPLGPTREKAEVKVEGRRIELVAEDEIVLKCGEASLVLRKNGRAALRGAQVETRAKGLNRIKGGTVAIN